MRNRPSHREWACLLALLFAFAACGKKEEPPIPTRPTLTAPETPAPKSSPAVTPEAEVKASSSPIELGLLVYRTRIRTGDSLWYQLRVRNISNMPISIVDPIFRDLWKMRETIGGRFGIYLELVGPDGKPVPMAALRGRYKEFSPEESGGVSGLLEVEGEQERAMVDKWKQAGLSPHEINLKLLAYNTEKRDNEALSKLPASTVLQPGESVETKSWMVFNERDKRLNKPVPHPIGEFAELEFFDLERPGKYKIRAVYDRKPTPKLMKIRGNLPVYPEEVMVRTPWVSFAVGP